MGAAPKFGAGSSASAPPEDSNGAAELLEPAPADTEPSPGNVAASLTESPASSPAVDNFAGDALEANPAADSTAVGELAAESQDMTLASAIASTDTEAQVSALAGCGILHAISHARWLLDCCSPGPWKRPCISIANLVIQSSGCATILQNLQ